MYSEQKITWTKSIHFLLWCSCWWWPSRRQCQFRQLLWPARGTGSAGTVPRLLHTDLSKMNGIVSAMLGSEIERNKKQWSHRWLHSDPHHPAYARHRFQFPWPMPPLLIYISATPIRCETGGGKRKQGRKSGRNPFDWFLHVDKSLHKVKRKEHGYPCLLYLNM